MNNRHFGLILTLVFILGVLAMALPASAQGGGDLIFDEPIQAILEEPGDEHAYTFRSPGDELLSATMTAEADTLDPILELYGPDGTLIAFNDDAGPGQRDAALTAARLAGEGVYTLVARSYGNVGSGPYTLTATLAESTIIDGGGDIEIGDTVFGEIRALGQVDRWVFEGTAGQVVSIAMNQSGVSDLDPLVELQSPDGEILAVSDDDGGWPNSLISGFTLPVTGTYTLVARSWGDAFTGPYTLTLTEGAATLPTPFAVPTVLPPSPGPGPDGLPPVGQEGVIALGQTVNGTLGVGFMDLWTFTGTANTAITIALNAVNDQFDTYLDLVGPDGGTVWTDDDGGPGLNSRIQNYLLPVSGTYTIRVRSYADRSGGDYTLTLEEWTPPEPNTGTVELGQTIRAELAPGGQDEWTFTGLAGQVITVAVYAEAQGFDTVLRILDADGQEERYNDDGGLGLNSQIRGWMVPRTGAYTFQVGSYGGGSGGPYVLTVQPGDAFIWPEAWLQGSLTPDQPVQGTFSAEQMTHIWSFEASPDQYFTLSFMGDAYLDILDADGNYTGYYDTLVPFRLHQEGEYFILVNGYGAGSYTLTLATAEAPQINTGNIEPGQAISATLAPGAEDEWTLVARAGETYTIAVYAEAGSFDTWLSILDSSGTEITYNDDGGPGLNSQLVGWTVPEDGAYILLVRSYSRSDGGPYMLVVEPGDSFIWPETWVQGPLPFERPVEGTFTPDSLTHVWTFEAGGDRYFTLSYSGDMNVELLDATGYYTEFYGPDVPFRIGEPGIYYLVLTSYRPGDYTVTLTPTEAPQANTGNIEPGQTITATLAPGIEDEWTFVTEAGQTYTIAVYAEANSFDTIMSLLDSSGFEIVYDDDGGPGLNSQVRGWVAPADGPYTIRVGSLGGGRGGPYSVILQPGDDFIWPEGWMQGGLGMDQTVEGTFTEEVMTHVWLFEVSSEQYFTVNLTGDAYPEVLDQEGNYAGYFDPFVPGHMDRGGAYYLVVYGYGPGDYTLTLASAEAPQINVGNIEPGQTITATLAPGAQDEWTFVGRAGQTVTVAVTAQNNSFDTILRLLDSNGVEIAYNDDSGGTLNSRIEGFTLPADGPYVIHVGSFGGRSGGTYDLTLLAEGGPGPGGVNLVGAVNLGQTVRATLAPGAEDGWTFFGGAGQVVSLALMADDNGFDTIARIVDSAGTPLAFDDDGGLGSNSLIQGVTLPADGTYTILVSSADAASGGPYTLYTLPPAGGTPVVIQPPPPVIVSPEVVSGELEVGETINAVLPFGATAEWTFVGQAGQVITTQAYAPTNDFDTVLSITDSAGNEIAFDDDGGPRLNSLIQDLTLPANDTYLITLHDYGNNEGGDYTLAVLSGETLEFPAAWQQGTFTLGQRVEGTWTMGAQTHIWAFTADMGHVALTADDNVWAEIFDANGQLGSIDPLGTPFQLPEAGEYFLAINGVAGDSYAFTLTAGAPPEINTGNIELNQTVTATLAPGAADEWTFVGEAGQLITISVEGEFDTILYVMDSAGTEIAFDDDGGAGLNSRLQALALPETGPYTIYVSSYGGRSGGAYTLSVMTPDAESSVTGELLDITLGETVTATLAPGAQDGWAFSGEAGQTISVAVTAQEDSFDTVLSLIDSLGIEVTFDDDGGQGLNSQIEGFTLPADDEYIILVGSYGDSGGGDYTLTLVEGEGIPIAPETVQGDIAPGETVDDFLDYGEWDHWAFEIDAAQTVSIGLWAAPRSDLDTVLEVVGPDGVLVGFDDDGGRGFNSMLVGLDLPAAGTYVFRVRGYADRSAGNYILALYEGVTMPILPGTFHGELTLDAPVHNALFSDTEHAYTFTVEEPLDVELALEPLDRNLLFLLEVSGPDGRSLASGSSLTPLVLRDVAPGQYTLFTYILDFGSTYTLTLREAPPPTPDYVEVEIGPVLFGGRMSGALDVGEAGAYTFDGEAGQVISLAAHGEEAFDPALALYAPDGTLLAWDDNGGRRRDALLQDVCLPASGAYRMVVFPASPDGAGMYTLNALSGGGLPDPGGEVREMALGLPVSGALDTAEAEDWWLFEGQAGQYVDVSLSADAMALVELYGPDGALLGRSDAILHGVYLPLEGQYRLAVYTLGESGGSYDLRLDASPAQVPTTARERGPIRVGQSIASTLDIGAGDRYALWGEAGQIIGLTARADRYGEPDTMLELYNPQGQLIAFNDDSGGLNAGLDAVRLHTTGEYTVIVRSYQDASGGPYTLTVSEQGGAAEALGEIGLDETVRGRITNPQQRDAYALEVDEVMTLRLTVTTPARSFAPLVELYGPDGRYLGSDRGELAAVEVAAGTYRIVVRSGIGRGPYTLTVAGDESAGN